MSRVAAIAVAAAAMLTGCSTERTPTVVGVVAEGCRPFPERGSGLVVDVDDDRGDEGPLVLTSAHVVAGADQVRVTHGDVETTATVVAFDPAMDLAYLSVDDDTAPTIPATGARVDSSRVDDGDVGVAHVVRDGRPVEVPVTVRRRIDIRTADVYVEGETIRPGFELTADIEEGDSGGAIVVDDLVVGVLWARSRRTDGLAYAIDPIRAGTTIRDQLATGDLTGVDLTRCP